MPKRVDHDERRERIARALHRVLSRDGSESVSLRHVAAEAGVTAGMVQHYFPSKDDMIAFSMQSATARYAQRIEGRVAALGADVAPRDIVRALLSGLIPMTDEERADAAVVLSFQLTAATRPELAAQLHGQNGELAPHLAALLGGADADVRATALLGAAEGLGIHVLAAGLAPDVALTALDRLLDDAFRAR